MLCQSITSTGMGYKSSIQSPRVTTPTAISIKKCIIFIAKSVLCRFLVKHESESVPTYRYADYVCNWKRRET